MELSTCKKKNNLTLINFMKTKQLFLSSAILLAVFCLSATSVSVSAKEKTKQCGVTNTQIQRYLEGCSHHHTVYWVSDISGTCNSLAGIENCGTATVFVSEGIIVGHSDANGVCPNG